MSGEAGQHQYPRQDQLQHRHHIGRQAVHVQHHTDELAHADALFLQGAADLAGVAQRHEPVALAPADLLPQGSFEAGGLLVVDPDVVVPQDPAAVLGGLHLDLDILRQGHGGPAAALAHVLGGDGVARAAHGAVQPQAVLGQLEEAVGHSVAGVVEPGHIAVLVLRAQVALDQVGLALVQVLAVDLAEHVRVHEVVRVEDHQQVVVLVVVPQGVEGLLQGNGLAGGSVRAVLAGFDHLRPGCPGHLRGTVGAIIGNDVKIIQLPGIIHPVEVVDDIPDDPLLVVGRNQHQEAALGIMILVILRLLPETEHRQIQLVRQHDGQPQPAQRGQRFQHPLQHLQSSSSLVKKAHGLRTCRRIRAQFTRCLQTFQLNNTFLPLSMDKAVFQRPEKGICGTSGHFGGNGGHSLSMVEPPINSRNRLRGGISSSSAGSISGK